MLLLLERFNKDLVSEAEQLQAAHYDRIAGAYSAHYHDKWSWEYRERFINRRMFANLRLEGKQILEAMCGSGGVTEHLLRQKASVTGLDISAKELAIYAEKYPQAQTICGSILKTGIENEKFDVIAVVGGLHHLHPDLSPAIREIHRVLKPGGYFCFAEPHRNSLPDLIRRRWYKRDSLFMHNEEAIDFPALKNEFGKLFDFKLEKFGGNLAYLFVLNSMVFRLPLGLKNFYSPAILKAEDWFEKLQGQTTSCMVIAQWRKK